MVLLGKAFVAFWSKVIITFFNFYIFLWEKHTAKVQKSDLQNHPSAVKNEKCKFILQSIIQPLLMIILVNRFLLRKKFLGVALWPFVILKYKELKKDEVFLNHERIHLRQQLELLIIPFYIWYSTEFLVRLIQYKKRNIAYRKISFEREAYANEKDLNYLQKRSFFKFIIYS